MSSSDAQNNVGRLLIGLLGIVFIVLRLTHIIHWNWIWVLTPFWFGPLLILLAALLALIG